MRNNKSTNTNIYSIAVVIHKQKCRQRCSSASGQAKSIDYRNCCRYLANLETILLAKSTFRSQFDEKAIGSWHTLRSHFNDTQTTQLNVNQPPESNKTHYVQWEWRQAPYIVSRIGSCPGSANKQRTCNSLEHAVHSRPLSSTMAALSPPADDRYAEIGLDGELETELLPTRRLMCDIKRISSVSL